MGKDQQQGRAPGPRAKGEKADCIIPDGSTLKFDGVLFSPFSTYETCHGDICLFKGRDKEEQE